MSANGALALTVCRSTLTGAVTVQGISGYVLIGSEHTGAVACAGNTIKGPLTVDAHTGGVEASANTITGQVRITNNSGSGLLPEDAVPAFDANRVNGSLSCSGNTPTLHQTGNTVSGARSGQCQ